jgi:signal transduction histidine kinase
VNASGEAAPDERGRDELVADNERLRALAARSEADADADKARLARELHDVLGQELTGLKLDAAWIARRLADVPPDAAAPVRERLARMGTHIDSCVDIVRRFAGGLRPSPIDDLGLSAAIEWQAREFESRSGLVVELALPEEEVPVERERAAALFRILQELLTNVARHAGARHVRVRLSRTGAGLVLEVNDDGRGIGEAERAAPASLGLSGIRERAGLLGGTVELDGAPGRGTTAVVRVPCPVPQAGERTVCLQGPRRGPHA